MRKEAIPTKHSLSSASTAYPNRAAKATLLKLLRNRAALPFKTAPVAPATQFSAPTALTSKATNAGKSIISAQSQG